MNQTTETVSVGDSIECDIHNPFPHVLRMKIETSGAAWYANQLIKRGSWRKCVDNNPGPNAPADQLNSAARGAAERE